MKRYAVRPLCIVRYMNENEQRNGTDCCLSLLAQPTLHGLPLPKLPFRLAPAPECLAHPSLHASPHGLEQRAVCTVAVDAHVAIAYSRLERSAESGNVDCGGIVVVRNCMGLVVAVQTGVARACGSKGEAG